MKMEDLIAVSVTYGLGGTATALLPRGLVEGNTVRSAIEWAIREKQESGSAAEKVGFLVGELIQSGHLVDVEEISGSSDSVGRPVALDDIALQPASSAERSSDRERSQQEDALHYHLTEPYRGGAKL
jgi:hypothetical protein